MADTIAARVARGAALLDERIPGWDQRIDLDTLDIDSCQNCVLSQLFGSPQNAFDFNPYYGFDIEDYNPRSRLSSIRRAQRLTAQWRRVIGARRAGGES